MAIRNSRKELTSLIKKAMRGNVQAFEQLVSDFSEDIIYNLLIRLLAYGP